MNFDTSVLQVAIEDIIPNRFQPRLSFEDTSLNELAASIRQHGIIQPLVLRKVGEKYEIIAGERRYKAATMAGLSSVPAVIAKVDEKTSAEVAIAENVQRRDLTAIEEAKSYRTLLDQGYMSQEQLARKMGLSQSAIANKLRLLNLPEEVQQAILDNKISERHGRALLAIKEPELQLKWLNRIIDERLTVRQLDELIKKEYKGGSMNSEINIEQIKQEATDIAPISNINNPVQNNNSIINMGPIDLGQQQKNSFFNSLESEAANMQMTESNPFVQNESPLITPVISSPTPATNDLIFQQPVETPAIIEEIEMLDTLDAEPPKVQDSAIARNRINNLVNELKTENYNIDLEEKIENGQIIYSIIIKNPGN